MNDRIPDRQSRFILYSAALLAGLVASSIHWSGLAVGGAFVGLLAPTTRRALVYGAGFGVLAWLVFLGRLIQTGFDPYADAVMLLGLGVGMAIGLGVVGASVREFI